MTIEIKQSTAHTFLLGPFVDSTDGVAIETGLATAMDNASTGIRLSKNGGNMADRNDATAPVHDEDGWYTIVLDATDTNTLGLLQVEYTEVATALPAWKDFSVVTANYWDSKYSTDTRQVDLIEIGGVAQSATDLKDFADDGYNPATNKVTGVLLTDTVTTLTGHTAQTADHTAAIADIPTVAEFNARTILSADYFDPAADTVALVTTTTNLTTNNDKTGYRLSATGVDDVWDETLAGHITADTTGLLLNDWQNAGRLDLILDIIAADVVNIDGSAMRGTDGVDTATMRGTNSALLAADINLTAGAVDTVTTTINLTTNNDKTGYALSTAGVDLIWDETLAGHVTADTTGLLLNDWQNAGRLDLILDIIAVDVAGLSGATMRGTDSAALATALTTAQNDLDILTGADGVNLLSATQTSIDAIETDTNSLNDGSIAEIAQGVPSATPTLQNAVMLMYMALRNKLDVQTSGTDALELHNNAGTQIAIKLLTDDGSDFSEAQMTTGV